LSYDDTNYNRQFVCDSPNFKTRHVFDWPRHDETVLTMDYIAVSNISKWSTESDMQTSRQKTNIGKEHYISDPRLRASE
jgi:hypothetical protein